MADELSYNYRSVIKMSMCSKKFAKNYRISAAISVGIGLFHFTHVGFNTQPIINI